MADYYTVIMAKVFIITVFLMGMVSLVTEIINGTI
jgi:hypothetical protein